MVPLDIAARHCAPTSSGVRPMLFLGPANISCTTGLCRGPKVLYELSLYELSVHACGQYPAMPGGLLCSDDAAAGDGLVAGQQRG